MSPLPIISTVSADPSQMEQFVGRIAEAVASKLTTDEIFVNAISKGHKENYGGGSKADNSGKTKSSTLCFYHRHFKEKAKNCEAPCTWQKSGNE